MIGTFSSVLENMPGGDYLGIILKVLGIIAGIAVAVLGILFKFDKMPWKLALDQRTVVLTHRGNLQQYKALLYTRKSWKKYWRRSARRELDEGVPLKKHTGGLVWLVPWYMTPEEFDHRKNTQSLTTIIIEKPSNQQWQAPLVINSVIGKSDADIRKVWRAPFRIETRTFGCARVVPLRTPCTNASRNNTQRKEFRSGLRRRHTTHGI